VPRQQGEVRRGEGDLLAAGDDAPANEVDDQLRRAQGTLGRGDGLAEGGAARQEPGREAVAQAHEGDLREGDDGLAGVDGPLVCVQGVDHVGTGGGVVELRVGLEGGRDQHVGEAILGAAEERQGVAGVEPQGLAATGQGDVQRDRGVGGEGADLLGDRVRRDAVVLRGLDIGEAGALTDRVDRGRVKRDRREVVVATQAVEPAGLLGEQGEARPRRPLAGGEEVELGG